MKIGSLKIGGFTILLIIVFSMFFFIAYMDKKILDLQREHFYNLMELNTSDSAIESWRIDALEKR